MQITINIPDAEFDKVINNAALAAGFDKQATDKPLTKQEFVAEALARSLRTLNTQGAMIRARQNQEAVNAMIV